MHRVLRPGPRPFIALGILFGMITVLLVGVGLAHGRVLQAWEPIVAFPVLYAVLAAGFLRARIVVGGDALAWRPPFGLLEQSVAFSRVTGSIASILAEPEHPVTLEIFTGKAAPALTLRLKLFRQNDVAWLLSLPQLKVER